jgi:hypothetical protein
MADGVIACTGEPEAFNTGVGLLHPGGRYVMVGVTGGQATPAILDHVVRHEIQIRGGLGQAWCVDEAMKIINSQRYPLSLSPAIGGEGGGGRIKKEIPIQFSCASFRIVGSAIEGHKNKMPPSPKPARFYSKPSAGLYWA